MPETIAPTDVTTKCPHCKKQFVPAVDLAQLPRLQGAKCPNCKLFVPAESLAAARAAAAASAIPAGSIRRSGR
jgi:hypothetical protein